MPEGTVPVPPPLYDHLYEVIEAFRILVGRPSGAMGTITLRDIIDYYNEIASFEGTIKQFLILFTAVENTLPKKKKTTKKSAKKMRKKVRKYS